MNATGARRDVHSEESVCLHTGGGDESRHIDRSVHRVCVCDMQRRRGGSGLYVAGLHCPCVSHELGRGNRTC